MTAARKCVPKISAVDLFCGAGGLTRGLQESGVNVVLGVDLDPSCQYPYTANNRAKFLEKSVGEVTATELRKAFPEGTIRLLAGCAPCQTFSTYLQKATSEDGRWWLLNHFSRLILEIEPDLVTMENVPGIQKQDVFKSFLRDLSAAGYHERHTVVDCADYGIPQKRSRLVLLASRLGPIRLLSPAEVGAQARSVRNAIGHLPPLGAGEVDAKDRLHRCSGLSATNLKRIEASKPNGSWHDWKPSLVADCHKRKTGKGYRGVYGRMAWDEPSPTITTQFYGFGSGRFGHPEQNRALSLREGAVLQGFPESYSFVRAGDQVHFKAVGRLIGNAVPVKLGAVIGASLRHHLRDTLSSRKARKTE